MEGYRASDSSAVDQWVSYAMQHATRDGFDFDLDLASHPTSSHIIFIELVITREPGTSTASETASSNETRGAIERLHGSRLATCSIGGGSCEFR